MPQDGSAGSLSIDNDAFCPLRWSYLQVDLAHARVKACCKTPFQTVTRDELDASGTDGVFNGPYVRARRLEMLRGERHGDCAACWQAEERGLQSYRQLQAAKPMFAEVTRSLSDQPRVDGAQQAHIEIILRTTCDLACAYCGPDFSSRWQREVERHGPYPEQGGVPLHLPQPRPDFALVFRDWFANALPAARYVQFNGGEPLIQDDFYALVSLLLAHRDGTGPQLGVITNLNTPPARLRQFLEVLPALHERHRFRLGVSFDSVGTRAEYIRSGLRWERMDANLRQLVDAVPGLDVQLAPTMSALNVSSIAEVVQYADRLRSENRAAVSFRPGMVMWPDFQSPLILLDDNYRHLDRAVDLLDEIDSWPDLRRRLIEIRGAVLAPDEARPLHASFFRWFTEYDRRRGTSFGRTFPELADFWAACADAAG